jgi:hypothetical protein
VPVPSNSYFIKNSKEAHIGMCSKCILVSERLSLDISVPQISLDFLISKLRLMFIIMVHGLLEIMCMCLPILYLLLNGYLLQKWNGVLWYTKSWASYGIGGIQEITNYLMHLWVNE